LSTVYQLGDFTLFWCVLQKIQKNWKK